MEAESYASVTILFSDIANFMEVSNAMKAINVIMFLNNIYNLFDSRIEKYDVYKVSCVLLQGTSVK